MGLDIKKALADPAKAAVFAERVAAGYLAPAFGARSKTEIDLLIFDALIQAGALDPDGPIYDISRAFNITTTRARTLVLNWQLRSTAKDFDLRAALIKALMATRFAKDGTLLAFGIESPLLREEIVARLKAKGVFADASFAREIVRLPVDAFVEFLDDLVDEGTKQSIRKILLADKQLPDRSFKALLTGVLSKLGEKVAGKAGEAVAGALVDGVGDVVAKPVAERIGAFLGGLLKGDAAGAAAMVTPDEAGAIVA